jgi:CPA2 family monovalent cation:H+ antiporter-2
MPVPILVITLAVIIGKILVAVWGVCGRARWYLGAKLVWVWRNIGEFSFIIASLGISLKVTSDFLYPIAVAVAAITTLLTPLFNSSADGFSHQLSKVFCQVE